MEIWIISQPYSHSHKAVVNVRRLHVCGPPNYSVQPDYSAAFPVRATPVRPPEPSSRHVSRLHDILTSGVRCVKPTVQLYSPWAKPKASASVVVTKRRRLIDYLTSGLFVNKSTSLHSNETRAACVFSWCSDHSSDGHINYRPIQTSRLTLRVLLILLTLLHRAHFCDYFIGLGTLYYKWQYAFLLVMNLLTLV